VVELHIGNRADARRLQDEVSRIYRQRIVPLIDQYCTELSAPDVIHRVPSLEVNLGTIDPEHFEEDLVGKARAQLHAALAAWITADERTAGGGDADRRTASRLELFAVFARTGSVPWWADSLQPQLVDDCLWHLIHTAPRALRRLMHELAEEPTAIHRIARHFDDRLLTELAASLAPALDVAGHVRLVRDLVAILQETSAGSGQRRTHLRDLVWRALLRQVSLTGEQEAVWPPLLSIVLAGVAKELGVAYPTLVADMNQVVGHDQSRFQSPIPEITAILSEQLLLQRELPLFLDARHDAGLGLAALLRFLHTLAARLPEAARAPVLDALDHLESGTIDAAASANLIPLLRSALVKQHLPSALLSRWLAEVERMDAAGLTERSVRALAEIVRPVLPQVVSPAGKEDRSEPVDLSFSDTDELYVDNAGVVILHPFLRYFLERLDLVDEQRQLKDASARHRAVGLLQYAVSEDPSPPEYLLPLNKVLCGMEPDDMFDFGPPVTAAEAEECANLLGAVIANAPILKNMSVNGLRATFLLRRGVLSSRDGAWLLRVERETYDVVLDRLPWTMQWVKLPWMDAPLRVEW
jgi:hypothetical protein